MKPDIICLGEMLVEIMRAEVGVPHKVPGIYKGPYPSGAPCIFIDSAARMGSPVGLTTGFIGVVGNDDFGLALREKLKNDGVDLTHVRTSNDHTTGIAFVQYNEDGSRKFIFAAGAAGLTSPSDIKEEYFENVKNLHIMGSALSISPSSREACYKAIKVAKKMNPDVIISFDPNLRVEMMPLEEILNICMPVLKETTILLPSGEEAEMLAKIKGEDDACKKLLEMGPKMIVLKKAKEGCKVFTKEKTYEVKSFKVEEVDPTGAGDSFGGAFIVEYLRNKPIEEVMKFANAVGALKVTSFGPMPSHTRKEVEEFIKNQS
ncbi:MAG: carbohydrate kinase family protein [Promethearchaeota archaeon]